VAFPLKPLGLPKCIGVACLNTGTTPRADLWLAEVQVAGEDGADAVELDVVVARFDATDGSTSYIQARYGCYSRLQLKNGVTASTPG
jgi:hypothetical protein